jgi:hypothetical protein
VVQQARAEERANVAFVDFDMVADALDLVWVIVQRNGVVHHGLLSYRFSSALIRDDHTRPRRETQRP